MSRIRVLIVDDETEFAHNLAKVLARRGLGVATSSSGAEAIERLGREDFDVVLLDVKMPGMDGIDSLSRIRARAPAPEVILMTGHLSIADESSGMKLGAHAYVLKPHPIPALVTLIEGAAARRRMVAVSS